MTQCNVIRSLSGLFQETLPVIQHALQEKGNFEWQWNLNRDRFATNAFGTVNIPVSQHKKKSIKNQFSLFGSILGVYRVYPTKLSPKIRRAASSGEKTDKRTDKQTHALQKWETQWVSSWSSRTDLLDSNIKFKNILLHIWWCEIQQSRLGSHLMPIRYRLIMLSQASGKRSFRESVLPVQRDVSRTHSFLTRRHRFFELSSERWRRRPSQGSEGPWTGACGRLEQSISSTGNPSQHRSKYSELQDQKRWIRRGPRRFRQLEP